MESVAMENCSTDVGENQDVKSSRSAQNFQNFMYELFEKNGVMNDLRSYLRGHIISVLRSAQTGDPPSCQKHFTQRLELTFQALNILIAEYLLRLEFSYTLSVFISEIPLANMVFSFAKSLMQTVDNDSSRLKFQDSDVWCILNYLGVKCDSEHASSIVDMYKLDGNSPLLLCILKTSPLFREPIVKEPMNSSQETIASSIKSSESAENATSPQRKPSFQGKCRHYVFCKTCQRKMMRVKEKYYMKKKDIAKNLNESNLNSLNVESLMKNISLMEKSLIDEMFEQLKSVYEAEMEMVKEEEEKRVKRSIATHSTQLQQKREEMEESFKAREAALQSSVEQKKRFLWGLARALREQHRHMARAMHAVRTETCRLSAKEDSLKSQLAEAQQILRQRGEDMRQQISVELTTLESHVERMKRERDCINRERQQLEQYKDRTVKLTENEDLKPHYDLLKNEFAILKKYLETAKLEPKCVIERSTITDDLTKVDVVLNNVEEKRSDDGRTKPKQVINDLKKQKNVNFSQSNLDEIFRERSLSRSRSSASSEAGDAQCEAERERERERERDCVQRLKDDNERLRCFAKQQRELIDSLTSQRARLQAELALQPPAPPTPRPVPPAPRYAPPPPLPPLMRPSTAPPPGRLGFDAHAQRMSSSASVNNFTFGWRKGAGEELSFFADAHPRIVVPGEAIPFVGVVTRHADNRRHLINQWRTLRRRISPLSGVTKLRTSSPIQRSLRETPEKAGPSVRLHLDQVENDTDQSQTHLEIRGIGLLRPEEYPKPSAERRTDTKTREKSPKSLLREAKEKLRNKASIKDTPTVREKSPNCVLREAKLRLRKLEIEAEAVEKSYLDFRRKQDAFHVRNPPSDRGHRSGASITGRDLDSKPSSSTYKLEEAYAKESTSLFPEPNSVDYDKCIKEYQTKISTGEHFQNKNTTAFQVTPIPNAYSTQEPKKPENYLETPLTEFRKYYHTGENENPLTPRSKSPNQDPDKSRGTRNEIIRQAKNDKAKELDLLKQNIGKIYNMPEQAIIVTESHECNKNEVHEEWNNKQDYVENNIGAVETQSKSDKNLLRIEVESISEVNNVKVTESQSQNMLLIIESSVDNNKDNEISEIESDVDIPNPMCIIVSPKRSSFRGTENVEITPFSRDDSALARPGVNSPRNDSVSSSIKSLNFKSGNIRKGSIKLAKRIKSPKGDSRSGNSRRSVSEKSYNMTPDGVVSLYQDDKEQISSVRMKLDQSKDALHNTLSELEQNEDPDYADDFSADVDNYNSRSEYNQSPISLAKTSEDENFWDS